MIELVAVTTGLSEESTSLRLAEKMLRSAAHALESRGAEVHTAHINLRTLAGSLADFVVTGIPSAALEEAFGAVSRAAAIITVAPVYKAAPAGIHTLFWQLVDDASLVGVPVLIGSTGGTARHSLAAEAALRPVISYLKGYALPTAVFAATDDWAVGSQGALDRRIATATAELAELTTALNPSASASAQAGAPDAPYAGPAEEQGRSAIAPRGLGERARAERGRDPFDPDAVVPFAELLRAT